MLIGVDVSRAVVPRRTGTEAYSLHATRELLRLGSAHRFRLYFNTPPGPNLFPPVANCERRTIPFPRLWTHLCLSAEMASRPPDVLWVPSHVLPLIHPRESVVTVHDLGHRYHPEAHTPWQRRYLEWSTRYHVRAAAHLVADSECTRQDLVRLYGADPDRIAVAHLGVDPALRPVDDPSEIARVRRRYGIGERYLLYVGTLQPRKNLVRLLEAFARLGPEVREGLQLALVGKAGWMHEPIRARARSLGLEGRVIFAGYVDTADLPALYSGAALFVMPSLYEGFCMPVLEAMACGTAVACSNASSLPEVVGDAALLYDPLDVDAMAATVERALGDAPLRSALIGRGLERARRFTWRACARRVLDVLERVGARAAKSAA